MRELDKGSAERVVGVAQFRWGKCLRVSPIHPLLVRFTKQNPTRQVATRYAIIDREGPGRECRLRPYEKDKLWLAFQKKKEKKKEALSLERRKSIFGLTSSSNAKSAGWLEVVQAMRGTAGRDLRSVMYAKIDYDIYKISPFMVNLMLVSRKVKLSHKESCPELHSLIAEKKLEAGLKCQLTASLVCRVIWSIVGGRYVLWGRDWSVPFFYLRRLQ